MINQSTEITSSNSPIQIVRKHFNQSEVSEWNPQDKNYPHDDKENIPMNIRKSKELRRQIETLFRKRPQQRVDQLTQIIQKYEGRKSNKRQNTLYN